MLEIEVTTGVSDDRTPMAWRFQPRRLLLLFTLVFGCVGICGDLFAQSERRWIQVSFEWNGDYLKEEMDEYEQEFLDLEETAKGKITKSLEQQFSFFEWVDSAVSDRRCQPGSAPAACAPVAEWRVQLASRPEKTAGGNVSGWEVDLNHFLALSEDRVFDRELNLLATVNPTNPNKRIYEFIDEYAWTAGELKDPLSDKLDEQLGFLREHPRVHELLTRIAVSKEIELGDGFVNIPLRLCDLRVLQGAKFEVALDGTDCAPTCNTSGRGSNPHRDEFLLRESGSNFESPIRGEAVAEGWNVHCCVPAPNEPGWRDRFQELLDLRTPLVRVSFYEPYAGITCPADSADPPAIDARERIVLLPEAAEPIPEQGTPE